MSVIKSSIQKASVSAKLFSSPLHLHIRSSQCLPGHLSLPHRPLQPISATALQRHVAVADSEDDICHADLHHRIIPPAVPTPVLCPRLVAAPKSPTPTFPAPQSRDCAASAGGAGRSLGPVLARPRGGRGPSGCRDGSAGTPQLWGWHQRGPSGRGDGSAGTPQAAGLARPGTAGTARGPLGA